MRIDTATRELSTEDLASVHRVLEPLRHWLRHAHARHGLRDGALGIVGIVLALAGLFRFEVSPLVVLLHLIFALAIDGLGAHWAARHGATAESHPFESPLHAMAFVEAVIAALHAEASGLRAPRIAAACLPHAERFRPPPIRTVLVAYFGGIGFLLLPIAQAASSLDRRDWLVLAALLSINAAQLAAAWRDARSAASDSPWERDWSTGAPPIGRSILWKHYRMLPLFSSFVVAIVLGALAGASMSGIGDRGSLFAVLESRLYPLATVLFAISGALHLLLLAAPWHARRTIAAIERFDWARAERRLRWVGTR